jgi:hypothetical protein
MNKRKWVMAAFVLFAAGFGAWTLAKPPGGGGGGGQNCKIVVCAQCPEGYVLATPQVWPNCCVCVPAP